MSDRSIRNFIAEGRRLLAAMRAEEHHTPPHKPRPATVEWLVWARNNAEQLIDVLEYRNDDYRHLAGNYRELRTSINRLVAVADWTAARATIDEARESCAEFGRWLRRALGEEPDLRVVPASPPPPLSPGVDYGRAGWKVAIVRPNGRVEVLRAALDTIDEVRMYGTPPGDSAVHEWTIRLTPLAKESNGG